MAAGLVAAAASGAAAATTPTPTGAPSCSADDADSTLTSRARIDAAFVDRLTNDSLADWDGGRLVRVGAAGDCSLFVAATETATLQSARINRSNAIVTGAVDLGANGTLSLVDDRRGALTISNPGPDYGTSLVVAAGDRSERVPVATGRFLEFVIRFEGDQTDVALWPADESWDGDWDVRLETGEVGDRRLRLVGEVSLDELAVGTERPTPTVTPTVTETEDDFPGADVPDDGEFADPSDRSDGGGDVAFVGLLFVLFGGVGALFPRAVARFGEQMDAIGSTTPADEVEPAEWNVVLTRILSAVFAAVGLGLLVLVLV